MKPPHTIVAQSADEPVDETKTTNAIVDFIINAPVNIFNTVNDAVLDTTIPYNRDLIRHIDVRTGPVIIPDSAIVENEDQPD